MAKSGADPRGDILRAAIQCYLSKGIAGTGMKEVAAQAGVARSTLYRYFPSRDGVLVAAVKMEMEAANVRISKRLAVHTQPADLLVEGLILAIKDIPQQPLLNAVFTSDEDAQARRTIWGSDIIVSFGEELMANVVRPALDAKLLRTEVAPEVLVEWVYRVLLSFLTLPSNAIGNDAQLRTTLHALLVPVLLR